MSLQDWGALGELVGGVAIIVSLLYVGTFEKMHAGVEIADKEESRRAIILFNMMMTLYQNRYYQFKAGYLDYLPDSADAATWPIYEVWRASGGASLRSPEFLEILDKQHQQSTAR